jgi:hypothetical protein
MLEKGEGGEMHHIWIIGNSIWYKIKVDAKCLNDYPCTREELGAFKEMGIYLAINRLYQNHACFGTNE